MASIIKRGDYQYQATVRRKGFSKQCKTFETERDAKNWAKVIESEIVDEKAWLVGYRTTLTTYGGEGVEIGGGAREAEEARKWRMEGGGWIPIGALRGKWLSRQANHF